MGLWERETTVLLGDGKVGRGNPVTQERGRKEYSLNTKKEARGGRRGGGKKGTVGKRKEGGQITKSWEKNGQKPLEATKKSEF